jgi:hypothetical protein
VYKKTTTTEEGGTEEWVDERVQKHPEYSILIDII